MKLKLKGIGTSKGRVKGRVRIIKSSYDSLNEGDVLVTEITDPSMTIIINKCSAIVCDIGGLTSHPSIIARELGIPCVVGCKNATEILKEGQKIVVDGTKGEIYEMD